MEKVLLNVKEVSEYLGLGETKTRELLRNPKNGFSIRIGNRLYAHKGKLDFKTSRNNKPTEKITIMVIKWKNLCSLAGLPI